MTDVYLDDVYIGTVERAKEFVAKVRDDRRTGKIPGIINIGYNEDFDEIAIDTTRGRARRPLIVVENGKSKLTDEIIT